jgi:hypothetical protein
VDHSDNDGYDNRFGVVLFGDVYKHQIDCEEDKCCPFDVCVF